MYPPKIDRMRVQTSVLGLDSPPPPPFCLGQGDIHVWHVDLDASRSQGPVDLDILSEDERARSVRFKFARDRQRFVVGRVSLRRILSAYIGLAAPDIRFSYGEFGKPALAPDLEFTADVLHSISFNCSHSGGRRCQSKLA